MVLWKVLFYFLFGHYFVSFYLDDNTTNCNYKTRPIPDPEEEEESFFSPNDTPTHGLLLHFFFVAPPCLFLSTIRTSKQSISSLSKQSKSLPPL